jgi:hypothetical protein
MRDGTVRTHGTFDDREALWIGGPLDPEVAVTAVRDGNQNPLGIGVNSACHPTHHAGDASIDTGYPGVVADRLGKHRWPATLFLNGASGNVHTADPAADGGDERAEGRRPGIPHTTGDRT